MDDLFDFEIDLGMDLGMDLEMDAEPEEDEFEGDYEGEIETNVYLENQEKGIELIAKLLSFNKHNKTFYAQVGKLNKLITRDFPSFSGKVSLKEEGKIYKELLKFEEKLAEIKKISLLEGKVIIGVGGGFSAGKSRFINSLLGESILPEDQTTTTCIPTYILQGDDKRVAYTFTNNEVTLEQEAIEALSHRFYDTYQLSFTHIIKNLVIQSERWPFKEIVLLDTPGYTKAESHQKGDMTDEHTARQHLQVADYLIWLVDSSNGVVKESDLAFISSLQIKTPILFVFNKADTIERDNIRKIIQNTKQMLKDRGIEAFAVTAYSSVEVTEYEGDWIEQFFNLAHYQMKQRQDIKQELENILIGYKEHFEMQERIAKQERSALEDIIKTSYNIKELGTLCEMYKEVNKSRTANRMHKKEFERIDRQMKELVDGMIKTDRD